MGLSARADEHLPVRERSGLYPRQAVDVTGRKVGGTRKRLRGSSPVADVDPKAVRAWAAAKGCEVSNRGRIPAAVIKAYGAAGN